jgi:hypothetical protein
MANSKAGTALRSGARADRAPLSAKCLHLRSRLDTYALCNLINGNLGPPPSNPPPRTALFSCCACPSLTFPVAHLEDGESEGGAHAASEGLGRPGVASPQRHHPHGPTRRGATDQRPQVPGVLHLMIRTTAREHSSAEQYRLSHLHTIKPYRKRRNATVILVILLPGPARGGAWGRGLGPSRPPRPPACG